MTLRSLPSYADVHQIYTGTLTQRRPQERLDRRLERVAKAFGGGYCQLQMPLKPALGVRGTAAGHSLGALEVGGVTFPPSNASLPTTRFPPLQHDPSQDQTRGGMGALSHRRASQNQAIEHVRCSTLLLKVCALRGWTLYQMGMLMVRQGLAPSPFEKMVAEARKDEGLDIRLLMELLSSCEPPD